MWERYSGSNEGVKLLFSCAGGVHAACEFIGLLQEKWQKLQSASLPVLNLLSSLLSGC